MVSGDYYEGDTRENGDYDNEVTGLIKLLGSEILRTREFGGLKLSNNEANGAIVDEGDAFFVGHNGRDGLSRVWYGEFTDGSSGSAGGTNRFKLFQCQN